MGTKDWENIEVPKISSSTKGTGPEQLQPNKQPVDFGDKREPSAKGTGPLDSIDFSKIVTSKGLNIEKAVAALEKVMREADIPPPGKKKGDGKISRDEGLAFFQKMGTSEKDLAEIREKWRPEVSIKIDDAVNGFKKALNSKNTDSDRKNLSMQELAVAANQVKGFDHSSPDKTINQRHPPSR